MIEKPQKPKSQNADLAHLPLALAPLCQLPHWVLWRWVWRREKWTKPPYTPAGTNAKSDDPSTWSDYPTTLDAAHRANGSIDGIGFMLRGTDLTTIDLDHCLDSKARPDLWAAAWLETLGDTYVERTPSGRGLRIIGIGAGERLQRRWTIKDAPHPEAAIEVYRNCERYITVTGVQIGGGAELQPIDAGKIVAHYDAAKEAAKGASKAKNGSKARNGSKNKTGAFDFNDAGPQSSIDYDEVIRNGAPNGQRTELFQACVWHLAAKGMSLEQIIAELEQYPRGIGEKYAGRLQEEVERSFAKWIEERTIPGAADIDPDDAQGPPPEPNTWDETDKNGKPRPTCTNVKRALLNGLEITFRRDAFHDRFLIKGKIIPDRDNLDLTVIGLRDMIKRAFDFDPSTPSVRDAVTMLCLRNEFDPVVDYLNALQWDGVERLDKWLITYAGAENTELNREFGRLTLIAAVRRARWPGTKFDPILVLEGPMGTGKSAIFALLAGAENFSDQTILGKHDREQQELLGGVWIFEIADLAGMKKAEVTHLKAFASRTHDRARPAYGYFRTDQPRRGIVVATTNDDQYLKEADRRFWPVKTKEIDIEALKRDRDQLWAEAAQREREGISIVLREELWEVAGVEQQAREEYDPWDDTLIKAIGTVEQGTERIETTDLLESLLRISISQQTYYHWRRAGRSMRRLGWKGPKAIRINGRVTTGYEREVNPTPKQE